MELWKMQISIFSFSAERASFCRLHRASNIHWPALLASILARDRPNPCNDVRIGENIIRTTVTANPDTVTSWIDDVHNLFRRNQKVVVGLNVKWSPNRRSGERNPVATLQLSAGYRCLIVQLIHIDRFPLSLRRFLRNPRYLFAGVGIENAAAKLDEDWGLRCENLYDVRAVAVQNWPEKFSPWPGLQELAREVVKVMMVNPRHRTLSGWENQELTRQQIHYACLDAYSSCRIGVTFYFGFEW